MYTNKAMVLKELKKKKCVIDIIIQ